MKADELFGMFLPGRTSDARNQHAGNGLLRHHPGREAPAGELKYLYGKEGLKARICAFQFKTERETPHLPDFIFFSLLTRTPHGVLGVPCTCTIFD